MKGQVKQDIGAEELLQTYGAASLRELVKRRKASPRELTKPAMVAALKNGIYDSDVILASLDALQPAQREVLDYLILQGGVASVSVFRRQLVERGTVAPPNARGYGPRERGSTSRPNSRKFEDVVASLGVAGLVFTTDGGSHTASVVEFAVPSSYLFIPQAILRHLPVVTLHLEQVAQPAWVHSVRPEVFLRDLYVLLTFARDQPLALTARGLLSKRTLVRIDEALRVPEGAAQVQLETDLGRLSLLRAVAQDLELLIAGNEGLTLHSSAVDFLSRPRGERRRQILEAYRGTDRWSELMRLSGLIISPRTVLHGSLVMSARARVLCEIADLPAGKWIAISHLIERLRTRFYEFLFARTVSGNRYYYPRGYELQVYNGDNPLGIRFERPELRRPLTWDDVEGEFIRVIVVEVLHWFGVVDLGGPAEGEPPTAFRLGEDGALLLRGIAPHSAPAETRVVVQPNFQIFAFEPTGEDVLFTLDRLAERVRAEQVVEYRLTRESVYAAHRSGMTAAEIVRFLETVSHAALPQNILRSLQDWGSQHDRVLVRRRAALLQAVDAATLDRLYGDVELAPLLGRRVGPTVALIPREHAETLYAALVQDRPTNERPLPALSEGAHVETQPALRVNSEGRISFLYPIPSIHLLYRVRALADVQTDGDLQLTPASLQRAARAGETADSILTTLEQHHDGALLAEVVEKVRYWAKAWGRGSLQALVLLQVERAAVLEDLMNEPLLRDALQPLAGSPTMAAVAAGQLDAVRAHLRERGMELSDPE